MLNHDVRFCNIMLIPHLNACINIATKYLEYMKIIECTKIEINKVKIPINMNRNHTLKIKNCCVCNPLYSVKHLDRKYIFVTFSVKL